MKWYQRLHWRVFFLTWVICVVLIGGVVFVWLQLVESNYSKKLIQSKSMGYAQMLIENYEMDSENWRRFIHRGRHPDQHIRFPLRIRDMQTNQFILGDERAMPSLRHGQVQRWVIETSNENQYEIELPIPEPDRQANNLIRFLLSMQMLTLILASALVATAVSFLVVRPINQLINFVRELHEQDNLSQRADGYLSQRQDEIGQLAREFNRMAGYVEHTLQAQQNLLRDVSHELRAPLARLQVAAAIIEQQAPDQAPEKTKRLYEQMNRECEQLSHLIDELLTLSRLEDVKDTASHSRLLVAWLTELGDDLQLLYPAHHIRIQVSPENLVVDYAPALFKRIVNNAIENACKYASGNPCIMLEAHQVGERLLLTIRDQGQGVDPALLHKVFDPFVRGQQHESGYGLGLTILKNAVRRLGGRVSAENLAAGGFALNIDLPLQPQPPSIT